jgi:ABC-type branched-subunit amino acid transport system substrate-binding protein
MKSCFRIIVVLLVAMSFVAAGCGSKAATPTKIIKIGVVHDLSGGHSAHGISYIRGTQTYWAEVNDRGGINGYKIELVTADDKGDPDTSLAIAKRFVEQDKVLFVEGTTVSAAGLAIIPYLAEKETPLIGMSAAMAMFEGEAARWYFCAATPNPEYNRSYLREMQKDNRKKVVMIYTNIVWGKDIKAYSLENSASFGIDLLGVVPVEYAAQDATAAVLAAKKIADEKGADALNCVTLEVEQCAIAKAIQSTGWKIPVYASDPAILSDIDMAGPEPFEGWRVNAQVDGESAYAKQVWDTITQRFGEPSNTSANVAYESEKVVEHVLKTMIENGIALTGANLRDALEKYSYPVQLLIPGPRVTTAQHWGPGVPHALIKCEDLIMMTIRNGKEVPDPK